MPIYICQKFYLSIIMAIFHSVMFSQLLSFMFCSVTSKSILAKFAFCAFGAECDFETMFELKCEIKKHEWFWSFLVRCHKEGINGIRKLKEWFLSSLLATKNFIDFADINFNFRQPWIFYLPDRLRQYIFSMLLPSLWRIKGGNKR